MFHSSQGGDHAPPIVGLSHNTPIRRTAAAPPARTSHTGRPTNSGRRNRRRGVPSGRTLPDRRQLGLPDGCRQKPQLEHGDNHRRDCLVGAAVATSIQGAILPGTDGKGSLSVTSFPSPEGISLAAVGTSSPRRVCPGRCTARSAGRALREGVVARRAGRRQPPVSGRNVLSSPRSP